MDDEHDPFGPSDLEQVALGQMLDREGLGAYRAAGLQDDDFADDRHRVVYVRLCELDERIPVRR